MGLGGDTLSQINKTFSGPDSLKEDNIGSAVSKILHYIQTDKNIDILLLLYRVNNIVTNIPTMLSFMGHTGYLY